MKSNTFLSITALFMLAVLFLFGFITFMFMFIGFMFGGVFVTIYNAEQSDERRALKAKLEETKNKRGGDDR